MIHISHIPHDFNRGTKAMARTMFGMITGSKPQKIGVGRRDAHTAIRTARETAHKKRKWAI